MRRNRSSLSRGDLSLRALDQIRRLARQDVELTKVALGRLVRLAPKGRNHSDKLAAPGYERRGLHGPEIRTAEFVEILGSDHIRAGLDVTNDLARARSK